MKGKVYRISISGTLVRVSKNVYLSYYRSKRRDRYYEQDIKTETAIYDGSGSIIAYAPSKEDSLNRLIEAGADFEDDCDSVEDVALTLVMVEKLRECLNLLTASERALIQALFFEDKTERQYAAESGMPQQTINSRKIKILADLKKFLKIVSVKHPVPMESK